LKIIYFELIVGQDQIIRHGIINVLEVYFMLTLES